MKGEENNEGWNEWAKYVLLTIERMDNRLTDTRNALAKLREEVIAAGEQRKELRKLMESCVDKKDLKMTNMKINFLWSIGTFVVSLLGSLLIGWLLQL